MLNIPNLVNVSICTPELIQLEQDLSGMRFEVPGFSVEKPQETIMISDRELLEKPQPVDKSLFQAIMGSAYLKSKDALKFFSFVLSQVKGTLSQQLVSIEGDIQNLKGLDGIGDIAQKLHSQASDLSDGEQMVFRGGYGCSTQRLAGIAANQLDDQKRELLGVVNDDMRGRIFDGFAGQAADMAREKLKMMPSFVKDVLKSETGVLKGLLVDLFPGDVSEKVIDQLLEQIQANDDPADAIEGAVRSFLDTAYTQGMELAENVLRRGHAHLPPSAQRLLADKGIGTSDEPVWFALEKQDDFYTLHVRAVVDGKLSHLVFKNLESPPSKDVFRQLMHFRLAHQFCDVSHTFADIAKHLEKALKTKPTVTANEADSFDFQGAEQRIIADMAGLKGEGIYNLRKAAYEAVKDHASIDDLESLVAESNARGIQDSELSSMFADAVKSSEPTKRVEALSEPTKRAEALSDPIRAQIREFFGAIQFHRDYIEIVSESIGTAFGEVTKIHFDEMVRSIVGDTELMKTSQTPYNLLKAFVDEKLAESKSALGTFALNIAKKIIEIYSWQLLPKQVSAFVWSIEMRLAKFILPKLMLCFLDAESMRAEIANSHSYLVDSVRDDVPWVQGVKESVLGLSLNYQYESVNTDTDTITYAVSGETASFFEKEVISKLGDKISLKYTLDQDGMIDFALLNGKFQAQVIDESLVFEIEDGLVLTIHNPGDDESMVFAVELNRIKLIANLDADAALSVARSMTGIGMSAAIEKGLYRGLSEKLGSQIEFLL